MVPRVVREDMLGLNGLPKYPHVAVITILWATQRSSELLNRLGDLVEVHKIDFCNHFFASRFRPE